MPLRERDLSHLALLFHHCRVTPHPHRVHFSTWNDVSAYLFLLITWLDQSHYKGFCLSLAGKRSPTQTMYASATQPPIETKNPRVNLLVSKWQHVWLLALDRRRKLNDALDRLEEVIKHSRFTQTRVIIECGS